MTNQLRCFAVAMVVAVLCACSRPTGPVVAQTPDAVQERQTMLNACTRSTTSGPDALKLPLATQICACFTDKAIRTYTLAEITAMDADPSKGERRWKPIMEKCVASVLDAAH